MDLQNGESKMKNNMQDIGLLFLRFALGGTMLIAHGWGKLVGFSEKSSQFPDPFGVSSEVSMAMAVAAEVVCSALIIVGFKTRFALVPLIITMIVAFFIIHGGDAFRDRELAFLYLVGFIGLFFTGAGKYSLDKR